MMPSGSNAVCRIVKPYSKDAFYVSAFDFPFLLFISIKYLTLYPDRVIISFFFFLHPGTNFYLLLSV